MANKNYYQYCAVPCCENTSIRTPNKLFIHVPLETNIRNKWLSLARINYQVSPKSNLCFCEDHFNLPEDMENYMKYHIMGSLKKIIMKPGCLPSKFECQPDRKRKSSSSLRPDCLKKQRNELIEQLVAGQQEIESAAASTSMPETTGTDLHHEHAESQSTSEASNQSREMLQDQSNLRNKSIQVYITNKYRSKSTQTNITLQNTSTSPIKITTTNVAISPFTKIVQSKSVAIRKLTFLQEEQTSESEVSSYAPSVLDSSPSIKVLRTKNVSDSSSMNEEEMKVEKENQKQLDLQNTLKRIQNKPRFYIGIPKEFYYLINIIGKQTKIPEKFILLCLKKIRLNTKFEELEDEFGISKSYASKVFSQNIPIIANMLEPFIVKLDLKAIKLNLPIAFRHKYYQVSCIIDCLEIEIEKPSKALHQALTWSQYKKGNTVKYLISSTPDGLINYISPGYGGRISDIELVENCDFISKLTPGSHILADRGFKHLEPLLSAKGFYLLRPPSVSSSSKLSKEDAKVTKQIASLRIHIERVIRRVREFSLLKPHAVVNSNLIRVLDEATIIACALINLQDSIIKK